jgi:biopolymer transport protein ExbB
MNLTDRIAAETLALFHEGGGFFWALLALAAAIAFSLAAAWEGVRLVHGPLVPARDWRNLLGGQVPGAASLDRLRQALDSGPIPPSLEETEQRLFARPTRRIVFTFVLVTTAPLIGLLGTVSGMFTTFSGLAGSSGAPIDVISRGISEALITTQTGLIIAVPSFLVCSLLHHRLEQLRLRFERLAVALRAGSLSR